METYICPAFHQGDNIISRSIPKERVTAIMEYYDNKYGPAERSVVTDMMHGDYTYRITGDRESYFRTVHEGELEVDERNSMIFEQRLEFPSFRFQPQIGLDHIRQRVEYTYRLPEKMRLTVEVLLPGIRKASEITDTDDALSFSYKLYIAEPTPKVHGLVQELLSAV
jgi:hypothetical protein